MQASARSILHSVSITAANTGCVSPIEKAWRTSLDGKCIDIGIVWFVNSAMTLTADTILTALPMTNILHLQLPKAQKAALFFVFSLGVFVMTCTVVRCTKLGPAVLQKDILCKRRCTSAPCAS